MKQRLFFLCLFILGVVFCHTSAHAVVYWDDDFEIPLTQAGRWFYSQDTCSSSPCPYLDISAEFAHSGLHSLRLLYDTVQGDDSHNVAITRAIPQTDQTLFTRFYYRTHAFTTSPAGTTHFSPADLTRFYPNTVVVNLSSSRTMAIAVQTGEDCYSPAVQDCYANWNATPNMATVNLNDDQWHCIETKTTMNSPGSANAELAVWVDGLLTMEYVNFRLRGASASGPNGNSSLSGFNAIQIYKQAGTGLKYFDQFAVGTERIGCGTLPTLPIDPLNPAALTWTESSTNVTGFNIYRGVDSICADSAPLPALTDSNGTPVASIGPMTIYLDNSFPSAATTVCYEVTAYNSFGESGRSNRATK